VLQNIQGGKNCSGPAACLPRRFGVDLRCAHRRHQNRNRRTRGSLPDSPNFFANADPSFFERLPPRVARPPDLGASSGSQAGCDRWDVFGHGYSRVRYRSAAGNSRNACRAARSTAASARRLCRHGARRAIAASSASLDQPYEGDESVVCAAPE